MILINHCLHSVHICGGLCIMILDNFNDQSSDRPEPWPAPYCPARWASPPSQPWEDCCCKITLQNRNSRSQCLSTDKQTNKQTNAPTVASTPKRAPAAAAVFCTTGHLPSQHLLTLLLLTYNNNNSIEGLRTTFSKKLQGAMLVWKDKKIADRERDPSKDLPFE